MKDFTYLPLTVRQGNVTTQIVMVSQRTSTGVRQKYPTDGIAWQFFLKERKEDPDPAAVLGVLSPGHDTADEVAIGIPLSEAMTAEAGTFRYHLDAVGERRETVAWGPFSVIDT